MVVLLLMFLYKSGLKYEHILAQISMGENLTQNGSPVRGGGVPLTISTYLHISTYVSMSLWHGRAMALTNQGVPMNSFPERSCATVSLP